MQQDRVAFSDHAALRAAIDEVLADEKGSGGGLRNMGQALDRLRLGGYFSTQYVNSEADGKYGSFVDNQIGRAHV